MDIAKYTELTGISVPASRQALVLAKIKRSRRILESMLGYSLDKKKSLTNYYEELGKSASDFSIPDDDANLEAPDEVVSAYRLYPYREHDTYLATDPFTKLNAVKLVFVRPGDTPNGITVKTFEADELRVSIGQGNVSKYIQLCQDCIQTCLCECRECVQLAVDADWVFESCIPEELMDVWAEMATYYSDAKKDIKSQTLGSHSYTRFSNAAPETESASLTIIKRYAGPNGSVSRTLTL